MAPAPALSPPSAPGPLSVADGCRSPGTGSSTRHAEGPRRGRGSIPQKPRPKGTVCTVLIFSELRVATLVRAPPFCHAQSTFRSNNHSVPWTLHGINNALNKSILPQSDMHVATELFFYSSICSSIALVFGLEAWSWTQRRRNERGRRHFPLRPFERFHSSSPPRVRPRHRPRHHHYDGLRVPPTVTATTIHNHTASPPLPTSVSCLSALIATTPCYYFSSDPPETRLLLAGGTQRFGPLFVRRGLDSFPAAAPPVSLPPSLSPRLTRSRGFRPQSARVLSRVARAGVEEN